jgi:hypothetical protein
MLANEVTAQWTDVRGARLPSRAAGSSAGEKAGPGSCVTAPPHEFPQGLEIDTSRGPCWRIDLPLEELWPEQQRWLAALARRPAPSDAGASARHAEIAALQSALPERVLLLDLESSGDTVFLVGLLHTCDHQPLVTQLIARHPGEEPAVLSALLEILLQKDVLVTFNGKAIDAPLLAERWQAHELSFQGALQARVHCDLLHHARRRWKDRLPNCKLQTLEQYICGRQRGESPVRDVAQAYDDFVAGADARPLQHVLENNLHEMVTLWQLALWLAHG